jgi:multidrug efflux pump
LGGIWAFYKMPKESNPDITIPYIYVSVSHEGIAPEDAERLLVRPLEQELRALEGLKEVTSVASEGHASVTLQFQAGLDPDKALTDVREKVDTAKTKLPADSDEPVVQEINFSQFPVLNLSLSGSLSEAQLVYLARNLKRYLESLPDVLSVDIGGDREDLLELVVVPQILEQYGIDYAQLFSLITNNNRLVAAGSIDTGAGRLVVKVPGLIEDLPDLLGMPVKTIDGKVVTFGDIATVQRTFKDPTSIARVDGQPAVVLEVSKRAGANIIETIETVKAVVGMVGQHWPPGMSVSYIYDESIQIRDMLRDLLNNVMFAIILVMIVIVGALGPRPSLLVGLTIPGAFLSGLLVLQAIGFTLNIVVLFSLILVAGMLVDGAIVVAEYAERLLAAGRTPRQSFIEASSRMAWPIISSTATTIAVFLPLLWWPGMVGEFMKYLPATVILVLLTALFMALVFFPVTGVLLTRARRNTGDWVDELDDEGNRTYGRMLTALLRAPVKTLALFFLILVLIYVVYGRYNHGIEFFPDVEPDSAQLLVRARGDLSIQEKDAILQAVEHRLKGFQEVKALYARTLGLADNQLGEDVVGVLTFQLIDWDQRASATQILEHMRELTADLPLRLEFRKQENGPSQGKPIKVKVSAESGNLEDAVHALRSRLENLGGLVDISDNRPLPGIEWRLHVNREMAARYGVDVATLGNVIQMATTGLKLADYRPDDAEDEVDIRLRLPLELRTLDRLENQTVNTAFGPVPIRNFTTLEPAQKTGTLHRTNGQRTLTVEADVAPGYQADERLSVLKAQLAEAPLDGVIIRYGGEEEDQQETMIFLSTAFIIALLLMALILVTQFNSLYQAALVLSAIVFSTAGVLLGLLITGRPFGIVMVGLGLIALAGIVVNNNIILIDTYNQIRERESDPVRAAVRTGQLRLRPVFLTAVTTVLGLLPMVMGVNVDLFAPELGIGAPSTQWWTQLSSAIAGGLTFATVLTLLITPCLLVLGERMGLSRIKPSLKHPSLSLEAIVGYDGPVTGRDGGTGDGVVRTKAESLTDLK